jgi:hypothetical protein
MAADFRRLSQVLGPTPDLEKEVRRRRDEIMRALDARGHFDLAGPRGVVYRIRRTGRHSRDPVSGR